ncbi:hypothetical protein B0H19DRAFT_1382548 [Mycena capillaripes]|nr:hypothetical protein B0H19DRAFT_1382548 [Mycena capillaripes]
MPAPSETNGQVNSVMGTAKVTVGNMTGMESMQNSGKEQHMKGETEQNAAQAKGMAEGLMDQATGMAKKMMGVVTGDSTQEASGKMQQASGQAKTDANKPM